MKGSPYLKECRLGDVIAAIQVLAYYKFYRLDVEKWAERITGEVANAVSLKAVFKDHPEFFQMEAGKAALVARRSFTRSYDVDAENEIAADEVTACRSDPKKWARLSRRPLKPEETAVLIKTAIDMHSRAIEQRIAGRWWVPLVTAGIGLLGVVIGVLIARL